MSDTPTSETDLKQVAVDARSGAALAEPKLDRGLIYVLYTLHVELFAGTAGKLFLGFMALLMLIAIAVMLLDVLSKLPELKICTAYDVNGRRIAQFPSHVDDLRVAKPIYETLPGWDQEITTARQMSQLPENARRYLKRLSEVVGRPVEMVSVGPDREQTILAGGSAS
jgi:hypothetical protein